MPGIILELTWISDSNDSLILTFADEKVYCVWSVSLYYYFKQDVHTTESLLFSLLILEQ